jgi:mitochondrial protein MBA1
MPGWFQRPVLKLNRSSVIPTGKALHVQMNEALAKGDKETLRHICTPSFYAKLAGTIDRRQPHQRVEWELIKYDQKMRYPRLSNFQFFQAPTDKKGAMVTTRQAVVSIASTQRVARYWQDSRSGQRVGALVRGSERTVSLVEHFVIVSSMDRATFELEPWKIWGTLPEATYEDFLDEIKVMDVMKNSPQ